MKRLLLSLFLVWIGPQSARAALIIEGNQTNLVVEASQVGLGEVLAALSGKLNMSIRTKLSGQTLINGRFSGSLNEVLKRLFDGYDFVIAKRHVEGAPAIEIVVLGRSGVTAVPVRAQTMGLPKGPGFR